MHRCKAGLYAAFVFTLIVGMSEVFAQATYNISGDWRIDRARGVSCRGGLLLPQTILDAFEIRVARDMGQVTVFRQNDRWVFEYPNLDGLQFEETKARRRVGPEIRLKKVIMPIEHEGIAYDLHVSVRVRVINPNRRLVVVARMKIMRQDSEEILARLRCSFHLVRP